MRKPVHILQVFPSFTPGGAQVRFTRLANAFGPDFSYTILAMDGKFDASSLLNPSIPVKLIKPATQSFPQSVFGIRRNVTSLRPDLTVTNNWGSMDAVLASWTAHLCPTIHSEDGFGSDEAAKLKLRRVLFRRALLNRVYSTVVPSKTLLRIAKDQYRLSEDKVTFIPNGIDIQKHDPYRRREARQSLNVDDQTVIIGFVGHLRPEKALHILIRAFAQAQLPNARLVLVGDGPCRSDLNNLVAELEIQARVFFIGHTSKPQTYMGAFDILAMSSSTEQMPMAILEAMAFGLPVVATDVGDCADMLGTRDPRIIVPYGNIRAYTHALKSLSEQPEHRQHLGAQNRKRCIDEYSFEKMTKAWAALYERALRWR